MPDPGLTADGLTYGYRAGTPVVADLTISLPPGTLTALTGRSGRGKSTLLYLLAGLLTPWRGSVRLLGRDLATGTDAEKARHRAAHIGFVFQDAVLDPRRSVLDAVLEPALYAGVERDGLVGRALDLMAEPGVALPAAARPGQISGGQAQRIGVCRALLLEPDTVFADEPTGNLDADSGAAVLAALERRAAAGCTVVVATHDERVVARCPGRVHLP